MNITIIGSGALGSLFAARLTAVPHITVTMLGRWPEQMAAISQHGLTMQEMNGRQHTIYLNTTTRPDELAPADLALVLVKSHQTARAAADCAAMLKPKGMAVTLQNGLGNADILAKTLGADRVIQATTAQGATVDTPGHVRHAGNGLTHIGYTPVTETPARQIADLLNQAGIATELTDNVARLVWDKLAVNAAINPLTALLGVANGALLDHAWIRAVMGAAAAEVTAVARAAGIILSYADASAQAEAVARATAANRSSMLQDLSRGAPTEIDAICGAIITYGQHHHISTPTNTTLHSLIKQAESTQPPPPAIIQNQLTSIHHSQLRNPP